MSNDDTFEHISEPTNRFLAGLRERMEANRGRHSWDAPVRPDLNHTFRSCSKCGLVKITRHEDDNNPRHWIEFERDGAKIVTDKTPACEQIVERHSEAAE